MTCFQIQQLVASVSDDKDLSIKQAINHVAAAIGQSVSFVENAFYNSEMND